MTQRIPLRVGDVDVLVEALPTAGFEQTSGRLEDAGQRVLEAFNDAQWTIIQIASQLATTMEEMGRRTLRPDHVEVQFGLSFTTQGNVVVVSASAEASLQVTIGYDKSRANDNPPQ